MPSKSTDLCKFDLPSGRLCRQVTLKNEQLCRHHIRLFRQEGAQIMHDDATDRLAADLNSLPLPELLRTLHTRLSRIQRAVRHLPEARLTLSIALDRLRETNKEGATLAHLAPQNPAPGIRKLLENVMESMK